MARFFTQSDLKGERGQKRRVFNQELKVGPVSVRFITIAIITILSIVYLAQSNTTATKGYQLKELQQEKEEAILENERLEVEASRIKALGHIKKTAQEKNMEPITEIDY